MQEEGTPFDVMRYIHNGVDNCPPSISISQTVRQWNGRWAYPKLFVGTNSMFFEELEKQCADVRSFRGELPHTDYVVGAISTAKETAINRIAHNQWHAAEKLATVAAITSDMPYPAETIRTVLQRHAALRRAHLGQGLPGRKAARTGPGMKRVIMPTEPRARRRRSRRKASARSWAESAAATPTTALSS